MLQSVIGTMGYTGAALMFVGTVVWAVKSEAIARFPGFLSIGWDGLAMAHSRIES